MIQGIEVSKDRQAIKPSTSSKQLEQDSKIEIMQGMNESKQLKQARINE